MSLAFGSMKSGLYTVFTLVVDDFGIKYERKRDAEHLMKTLKKYYPVSEDWKGNRYILVTAPLGAV